MMWLVRSHRRYMRMVRWIHMRCALVNRERSERALTSSARVRLEHLVDDPLELDRR